MEGQPFTDVVDNWALDATKYVYEADVMNDTSDTTFAPNKTLGRAMLVTILYRMEGEPAVTAANAYADVAVDTWYTNAVIWATENEIVKGYGNGNFDPTDLITREQIATILLRYSQYKDYDVTASNDLSAYADQIGAWVLDGLKWANGTGLFTGRTAATSAPKDNATRSEAATILMRYLENVAK